MSSKRPRYSWDTNVFLALFKEELDKPLEDIRAVAAEIESDKADLILSTMVYAELLDIVTDTVIRDAFNGFRKRHNVKMIDLHPRVAEKSHDVTVSAIASGRSIKPPDAIIVATALLHKADVLHTFDDKILKASSAGVWPDLKVSHPRLLSGQKLLNPIRKNHGIGTYPRHLGRSVLVSRFGETHSGLALASFGHLAFR